MRSLVQALGLSRGAEPSLAERAQGRAHREVVQRRYRRTHGVTPGSEVHLRPLLGKLALPPPREELAVIAERYGQGWFDLLGSGWRPFHAAPGPGLQLPAGRSDVPALLWDVDVLSGHRWDPSTWYGDIDRTPGVGVDIKLPWELGRLQHLPQLALAHHHATAGAPGFRSADRYRHVIEAHLTDFITHNPVGFGVQWACAMDVGIRVANIVLALDILAASQATLNADLEAEVTTSVHAHARFLSANLEWTRRARTNHYLADICGLLWACSHLEGSPEADSWLCLAARELQAETASQFDRDGAGSEGSTSYHRLSAEMVVWSTAILLALPEDRLGSLRPSAAHLADLPLPLLRRPVATSDIVVSRAHLATVARMVDLSAAAAHSDGGTAQMGDNDSGRFVKPAPTFLDLSVREVVGRYSNLEGYDRLAADDAYWWEDPSDHSHLTKAVDGLFGRSLDGADAVLVAGYVRRPVRPPPGSASLTVQVGARRPTAHDLEAEGSRIRHQISLVPGGDGLLTGLLSRAFVPFGLYLWRSPRLFLAVRCGPVGQGGRGGHDHRDQLSVELLIDGVGWFVDPGSATYTRDPDLRNAYRSARAHAGPARDGPEDWTRTRDLFGLGPLAAAGRPRWYGPRGFIGERSDSDGVVVRTVRIEADRLVIEDWLPSGRPASVVLRSPDEAARFLPPSVPFSPGYGWQERRATR